MDTDADLQSKLMEDNVFAVLDEVGYRGIPSRETLESKDKIVRYYYIYIPFSILYISIHY